MTHVALCTQLFILVISVCGQAVSPPCTCFITLHKPAQASFKRFTSLVKSWVLLCFFSLSSSTSRSAEILVAFFKTIMVAKLRISDLSFGLAFRSTLQQLASHSCAVVHRASFAGLVFFTDPAGHVKSEHFPLAGPFAGCKASVLMF